MNCPACQTGELALLGTLGNMTHFRCIHCGAESSQQEDNGIPCNGRCGKTTAADAVEEQYSLGIYAGRWCAPCWAKSGYRKDGPEGFDPADAGESYEPEPDCYGSERDW